MRTRTLLTLAVLLLAAAAARADVIVLKSGGKLTGRIVSENEREVVLLLEDGMKMTLGRSLIASIERKDEPEPAEPEPAPPEPEPEPEKPPPPEPEPEPAAAPPASVAAPEFFGGDPRRAWERDFASYPELVGSGAGSFRAYECVRHAPLGLTPSDPRLAGIVAKHGHGGSVSRWEFEHVGIRDIRFGDRVKFIAEITAPFDGGLDLIRLDGGPSASANRIVVLLLRRDNQYWRYATTSEFDARAFKKAELDGIEKQQVPVRTYRIDYAPVATTWLVPSESDFLPQVTSPFGESIRVKLSRYRYRLEWFGMPEDERPKLDPDLLARNVVRPLAAPGRPVATEQDIRKYWGTAGLVERKLSILREEVKEALARIGVLAGGGYYVERDRVGVMGSKGISIETRRYRLDAALLAELLRD